MVAVVNTLAVTPRERDLIPAKLLARTSGRSEYDMFTCSCGSGCPSKLEA